jgi:hypothetical protein
MPMIEKIVQTAKHAVNAIVDIERAVVCPAGRGLDGACMIHRSPCCALAFGGVTMVRARTCRLELNQIWRKFRNDPGADRQGYQIGTMQYAQCPRLAVDSAAPVCGVSYRSGFGFGADSLN